MTWDELCTIRLSLAEFCPNDSERTQITGWLYDRFDTSFSVPVRLIDFASPHMRRIFEDFLNTTLRDADFVEELGNNLSVISRMTLENVSDYYLAAESLVRFDFHGLNFRLPKVRS